MSAMGTWAANLSGAGMDLGTALGARVEIQIMAAGGGTASPMAAAMEQEKVVEKEQLIRLWKKLKDLETRTIEFRREIENQLVELTGGAKERGATKLDEELTISFAESIEIDKGATITGALASVVRCKYELDRKAYAALSEADKLQVNESLTFKPKRPSFELKK